MFDHNELAVINEEEKLAYLEAYFHQGALPKQTVKLKLSQENKQKLKIFVCKKGPPGVSVSANDCLVSLIWSVFIETTAAKMSGEEIMSTLFLQCNGRFRRQPALPVSFFGNVILSLPIIREGQHFSEALLLSTTQKIREKVSSVNNDYVQSTIDFLATNENSQIAFPQKYDFIVSNWDRPFDWYGDWYLSIHKGINRHCFFSKTLLKCQLSQLIPRNGIMTSASCQNLHVRLIHRDKQTRWFSKQMSVNQQRASLHDIIFGETITLEMF